MGNAKKKTTMAKLNREQKLREKRMEKQARKDARKQGADDEPELAPAADGPAADHDDAAFEAAMQRAAGLAPVGGR